MSEFIVNVVYLFIDIYVSGILISDLRCHIPTFRSTESRKRKLTDNANNI